MNINITDSIVVLRQMQGSGHKDLLCFQGDFISLIAHEKMRNEKNTLIFPYAVWTPFTIEGTPQYIAFIPISMLLPCTVSSSLDSYC